MKSNLILPNTSLKSEIKFPQILLPFRREVFAMPRTVDQDPLQKFMFRVSIPGYPQGLGFMKVSGLKREMAVIEYTEGMYQYPHKLAGREKFEPWVMERGAFKEQELEKIYFSTLKDHVHRTTVTLEILNRYGDVRRTYTVAEAWASAIEVSELDAASDDVVVDKMTLQFEYYLTPSPQ